MAAALVEHFVALAGNCAVAAFQHRCSTRPAPHTVGLAREEEEQQLSNQCRQITSHCHPQERLAPKSLSSVAAGGDLGECQRPLTVVDSRQSHFPAGPGGELAAVVPAPKPLQNPLRDAAASQHPPPSTRQTNLCKKGDYISSNFGTLKSNKID